MTKLQIAKLCNKEKVAKCKNKTKLQKKIYITFLAMFLTWQQKMCVGFLEAKKNIFQLLPVITF